MTTAIVLAGGLGTRLRSVVSDVPKPMAQINGRPFLERLLEYWSAQGVTHFVLAVGYLAEIVIKHFGDEFRGIPISYSIEKEPLGTGGALLQALTFLDKNDITLVLNGDTFFQIPLSELVSSYEKNGNSGVQFSLMKTNNTDRYMGLDWNPETKKISSLTASPSQDFVYANGGVYLINPEDFIMGLGGTKSSLELDIFPTLFNSGVPFSGVPFGDANFIDIGVPEDYHRASRINGLNA